MPLQLTIDNVVSAFVHNSGVLTPYEEGLIQKAFRNDRSTINPGPTLLTDDEIVTLLNTLLKCSSLDYEETSQFNASSYAAIIRDILKDVLVNNQETFSHLAPINVDTSNLSDQYFKLVIHCLLIFKHTEGLTIENIQSALNQDSNLLNQIRHLGDSLEFDSYEALGQTRFSAFVYMIAVANMNNPETQAYAVFHQAMLFADHKSYLEDFAPSPEEMLDEIKSAFSKLAIEQTHLFDALCLDELNPYAPIQVDAIHPDTPDDERVNAIAKANAKRINYWLTDEAKQHLQLLGDKQHFIISQEFPNDIANIISEYTQPNTIAKNSKEDAKNRRKAADKELESEYGKFFNAAQQTKREKNIKSSDETKTKKTITNKKI